MSIRIPDAALTQHVIALGKTGSGKSSALRVLVEHILDGNGRVCILDPKGDWWGLKLSASGKTAGYPVVIFGGEHADVPINAHAGAHVAELVATGNRPCIIDLGGWSVADRTRFFIDYAATLFRTNKHPLRQVIDEVHNFCPQGKVMDPDAGKMLHWSNRLASEGRGKNVVLLAASQRPQKVHKDFVTSCETLIAMRVIHPLDRGAIKDWIDGCPDRDKGKEVLDSLASMKRGEAWAWSPEISFGPQRLAFPMFKTYDSFSPQTEEVTSKLRGWAEIDLEDVKTKLAKVVEEHKSNDPKELKARIAELTRQVNAKPAPAAAPKVERVEVPVVTDKIVKQVEKIVGRLEAEGKRRLDAAEKLKASGQELLAKGNEFIAALRKQPAPTRLAYRTETTTGTAAVPSSKVFNVGGERVSKPAKPTDGLTPRQQKFLDAAACLQTLNSEVSRVTVSGWVGVHPRGGSVGEELKVLCDAGYLINDRGRLTVTDEGMKAAGAVDTAEAIDRAKARLENRQRNFFELIAAQYPNTISREQIAAHFELHPRGGSLGEDLGALVGRGLVENNRGQYRARDFLFAGAEA